VVATFPHSNFGGSLVFERSNRERQRWESFVYFNEEGSSALRLQVIGHLDLTLEDSCTLLTFLWNSFSRRYVDIESDNITWCELELFYLLSWGLLIDDDIVSVNQMLFDFVRKNALNWVTSELSTYFSNCVGDTAIG
jgi:hypothetical protein